MLQQLSLSLIQVLKYNYLSCPERKIISKGEDYERKTKDDVC